MKHYRAYILQADAVPDFVEIKTKNDDAPIAKAHELTGDQSAELWFQDFLLERLE